MFSGGEMTTMNVTTHAVFIPEIWSDEVIEAAESRLVLAGLVNRAYEGQISQKGDIVRVPGISNLSANDKASGTAVTVQAPTETETTLSINKHKEVSFFVEDILKVQASVDLRDAYTRKAGYALAKVIDTDLASLYSGLSQSAGDGSSAVTEDILLTAMMTLDQADVPEEDRVWVFAPSQKANILKLEKFSSTKYLGDKFDPPVRTGVIGELYGSPVYITNQIQVASSVAHNLYFHKDAFALAIQMGIRLQAQYQLMYTADLVVGDVIYGVGEMRDSYAVDIKTTNVAPTS